MRDRAYAVLTIKGIDAEQRIIEGIASTPTPDRGGDIMVPTGAQFTLPMPLKYEHKVAIGEVFAATVHPDGIHIKARISTVDAAAPQFLKDRLDEAWHSIKADPPLARGLSIGWSPLEVEPVKGTRFKRYPRWMWGETSVVNIPMNTEATITAIKSLDQAASGQHLPGVAGLPTVRIGPRSPMKPTTAEQITTWENKRAALAARMAELMSKASDAGSTLDDEQSEEYDGLDLEVKSTDAHLVRLRALEKAQIAAATPVTATNGAPNLSRLPALPQISVRPNVAPGSTYVRYVLAMLNAKGDSYRALEYAKQWKDSTPEVELMIKAAVAPGTTTDPAWAGALVTVSNLTNEFIELSRPATLLGKIPGLTSVPFNVSVPIQTGGGTYKWVGQGKAKPVGKLQFGSASLAMAKAAGIIVLTEELVRSSSPSAEGIVRREMVRGIAQFLDTQFTDPAVAAVVDVSPASITNGAGTAASADNPATDLGTLVAFFSTNNIALSGLTVLMSETNAYAMGVHKNALGVREFPSVGVQGGNANGINIVASNTVGDKIIGLAPEYILIADEGGVQIDVSREATVQMNDAPVNPADPATTVWSSFWQDNLVGLRAERFINWKRSVTPAVYYLTGASYPF